MKSVFFVILLKLIITKLDVVFRFTHYIITITIVCSLLACTAFRLALANTGMYCSKFTLCVFVSISRCKHGVSLFQSCIVLEK